jgi:sulfur carrier protein
MCSIKKKIIRINGATYFYKAPFTVLSLLDYLGFKTNLIVIDYNGTILQKESWHQTNLKSEDNLEILTVAGGG